MRRALAPVVFFALAACSTPPKDSALPNNVRTDPATDPNAPVSSPPNGGDVATTPSEIPAGCSFRVKGECYAEQKAACAAAGCEETCIVMESYPAQISCK